MSTYYKHTKTETVEVPYSFRCEQCLKDSGPLHAIISGAQAEMNSNFKKLDDRKQQKLEDMAHTNLVKAVKGAYTDATEKQTYSKAFRLTLRAIELYDSNRPHPEVGHKSLENLPERRLRALPSFQWSFRGGL